VFIFFELNGINIAASNAIFLYGNNGIAKAISDKN